ncbi:HAMP domain-containing histidine kinase [Natronolimnobius sp. AArcel1]|uniref:sensor histidine kinase n=1 Tax=Natronolimnobius sp. AArcel1 TaxID=1679093 RepID=UPI0013ED7900|nr:HAMP domain-containing sensor histidine kinase [Natronolimnobius sp. AArcel1]NGM68571.1 HAMP domain-containing histidine kinase [Natronolimnobius sp. AArcel1]
MSGRWGGLGERPWLSPAAQRVTGVSTICGCGLVLVAVSMVYLFRMASSSLMAVTALLSVLLALVVVGAGGWLWHRSMSGWGVLRVAGWMVIGMAGLGTLFLWTLTHQLAYGGTMPQAHFVLANTLAAGSVIGIAIGLYDVQGQQYRRQLERERSKLSDERAKLAFLNRMLRHYVLNGVNIITGHVGMLKRTPESDGREHLDVIHDQSEDVADVVRKFRYLTQALVGETERGPRDLSGTLSRRITITAQAHEQATIQAEIPDGVTVLADEMLDQVFENLLTNAIVHNDQATPRVDVTVTEHPDTDTVSVTIVDNGPGLPEEQRASILEWETKREEDTDAGIGLAIVETLVDRYDGSILVSDAEPRGTSVRVELPTASGTALTHESTSTADRAPAVDISQTIQSADDADGADGATLNAESSDETAATESTATTDQHDPMPSATR